MRHLPVGEERTGNMKTLYESLLNYDITLLRAIAERRGIELSTDPEQDRVQELASALLRPESVDETLAWQSPEERHALEALLAQDGRMRAHRFAQQFGEIRRFGPGSLAREAPWRAPVSAAEGLWYCGLIARAFAEEADTVVEFVFIPSDVMPLLPSPEAARAAFSVPEAEQPHTTTVGDLSLIDDLCTMLALARERQLYLRHGQLAPEASLLLQEQLLVPDEARIEFLSHLAQAGGFVQLVGRTLGLSRERVQHWLGGSRQQQIVALQEIWREDAGWNDLWHVPDIRCEETGWRNDPVRARHMVLDLIGRCPTAQWLSISGLVAAVREQFPDYARPDGDFESWYIRDVRTGEYLTGLEHWDRIEGALLVYLIAGPLHWLGIVSLGFKQGWQKPSSFRITPWGAVFLGLALFPLAQLPAQPALVTPDGEVHISREAPLSDRFQLARVADWRASGQEYVYAITAPSLARSLGSGIEVKRIEGFLTRISGDPLPAAMLARIRGWAARYGQVSLHRVVVLEARSPEVMSQLRQHERIRGYLRRVLSPTISLVRESDWPRLTDELYRAGYLPEIIQSWE
jgi:hypothetical protein